MNTVNVYWRYDLFKLIVTMLLLLILLLSFPKPGPNPPIAEGDSGDIVTATGGSHPEDLEPGNPDSPQYPLLPPFPPASGNLAIDDTQQYLVAPDGHAVYELDNDDFLWKPVIPEELLSELPQEYEIIAPGPAAWTIQSMDGQPLYTWNVERQTWEAVPPTVQPASVEDCPVALAPRLQPSDQARTLVNLNLRSSPGIKDNWMLTNIAQTQLTIVGGPVCVIQEGGAYWWWEVENPSGLRGWSAEAHQGGGYYFLEPVQ